MQFIEAILSTIKFYDCDMKIRDMKIKQQPDFKI